MYSPPGCTILIRSSFGQCKNTDSSKGVACIFGGHEGDRTLDLTDANRMLSQLSYEPEWGISL